MGGPSSAAAGWVEELLAHVEPSGAPLDFVSTHTYGSPPLDFRPSLERYGRAGTPIWWTEWGVTPTHFNEVSDAVFSGVFLLRGMASAMDRIEALSYWVVSDHFEELGRPPALLHGGFGLRTVGELRKPRWWALALMERLDDARLPVTLAGDGGGSLVEAIATRDEAGSVSVLAWNMTLDQSKAAGAAELDRSVVVTVDGLRAGCDVRPDPGGRGRRPLQRRRHLGRAQGRPGLADRRAVGAPARGRPARGGRSAGRGGGRRLRVRLADPPPGDALDGLRQAGARRTLTV